MTKRILASGNEAIAMAAFDCGVNLGTGYPGTPSSEILDQFHKEGGCAQWAPNEKAALEVAIGAAFANGRALVTMKHVGLNVACDPLFTAAYTGVNGGLVIAVADDPSVFSSQNEQDTRLTAVSAKVPVLVSDREGPMEVIGSGAYGFHFPSGDVEQCAAAIRGIMQRPDREALAEKAYRHVAELFDVRRTAREYLEKYRESL